MIDETIELAKYKDQSGHEISVTIQTYENYLKNPDGHKILISTFIYQRFYQRYIKPFEGNSHKNGFSIMANCCLLIEAITSFKNGWETTNNKSEAAFKYFFSTEPEFKEIANKWKDIYKNIRCGILHQGETTGGFRITRMRKSLFDEDTKKIDATIFLQKMKSVLQNYESRLNEEPWDSEVWDNFRRKMRSVIKNCDNPDPHQDQK